MHYYFGYLGPRPKDQAMFDCLKSLTVTMRDGTWSYWLEATPDVYYEGHSINQLIKSNKSLASTLFLSLVYLNGWGGWWWCSKFLTQMLISTYFLDSTFLWTLARNKWNVCNGFSREWKLEIRPTFPLLFYTLVVFIDVHFVIVSKSKTFKKWVYTDTVRH